MYLRPWLLTCHGNIMLRRYLHSHYGKLWTNVRRTVASQLGSSQQKIRTLSDETKTRKLRRDEVNEEMKTNFSRRSIYKKLFTKPSELFRQPQVNLPIQHCEVSKRDDDRVHQRASKRSSEDNSIKKQEENLKQISETIAEGDWLRIYQQPPSDMRILRFISRAKLLQLVGMVTACPYAYMLLHDGHLSERELVGLMTATGLLTVALCLASAFSMKLIGQLAYNKEHDLLRISRLTFLTAGKQHDILPTNRVVPFLDRATRTDLTYRVQRLYITDAHSLPRIYYFSLARGRVIDVDKFRELLGIPVG